MDELKTVKDIKSLYFKPYEFTSSWVARREGINNNIKEHSILSNVQNLVSIMDLVRGQFGPISINSWFRCALLNSYVGGAYNSLHKIGAACDMRLSKKKMTDDLMVEITDWICNHVKNDLKLIYYPKRGFIHINLEEQRSYYSYKISVYRSVDKKYALVRSCITTPG